MSKSNRVIAGNEKVINARLQDAEFFYHTDLKMPLAKYSAKLKHIVFQAKLGSLYDKMLRIAKLSSQLAALITINAQKASRAGFLAKADLATTMVGEFPELQGIMGYYYALPHEDKEVAIAIKEHYLPRFANDNIPSSKIGVVVAIADRIDTLVGIFALNKVPTGDKDPFGLRRAALGILNIIIEHKLMLDLRTLIQHAIKNYNLTFESFNLEVQVLDFILERLKARSLEHGIPPQVFAAVYAKYPTQPLDFIMRLQAVTEFQKLPQAESLITANKRVSNILKRNKHDFSPQVSEELLVEPAEQQLYKKIVAEDALISPLCAKKQYTKALLHLASLKIPIDNFFDTVLVMTDDSKLRDNRLALLRKLRDLFLQIADIF